MKKPPLIGVSVLALIGCQEEQPKEATFKHPVLGVVGADHPKYLEAYNLCDERVYGQGFEINGVVYTSKADVFAKIRPILTKTNKSKDDADIIARWSGGAQTSFIQCVAEEGFVFVRGES